MAGLRLLYLVTEDWYFLSHRLPMARAARAAGFEVHVATRVAGRGAEIEREGFCLHPLRWRRGSADPRALLASVREVRALYRTLAPAIVHHVALQPSLVGSLAVLGLPPACVNAVVGLGFAYASPGTAARLSRVGMRMVMRALFRRPRSVVLVQNPDDRAEMTALGIPPDRIALIAGSGVDVEHLRPLPEPDGPVTIAYAGRLLENKGLPTLIAAQAQLAAKGHPVRLVLAGASDPFSPAAIPEAVLAAWRAQPGVAFLGHVADIRTLWAAAHIAVLPSRREGLPLSLLEAAACGRPLIATDVPGCREVARAGVNALLVPPDDAAALAEAIARLAADAALRARFGAASRRLVEAEFSSARIGAEVVRLYHRLLGE